MQLLVLVLALALLVGNAAAGLAGGLAGSLALAAAAVLRALAEVAGIQRLDMLHGEIPPLQIDRAIIARSAREVNYAPGIHQAKL